MGFIGTIGMFVVVCAIYVFGQLVVTGSIFIVPYLVLMGGMDGMLEKLESNWITTILSFLGVWFFGILSFLYLGPFYTVSAAVIIIMGMVCYPKETIAAIIFACMVSGLIHLGLYLAA